MLSEKEINDLKQLQKDFEKELSVRKIVIKKDFKFLIDDEGILRFELGGDREQLEKFAEALIDFIEKNKDRIPSNIRSLVKATPIFQIPSIQDRKKMAEYMKDSVLKTKTKKMAIYGGGAITRTIFSFILSALGLKNIRHFDKEKEALGWLREE